MPPDFFNSREDAILVWTVVILGYAMSQGGREIAGASLNVARAFFHPKLLLLYGSALLYSALLVYGAKELDIWHTAALKATIYWFLGTAFVLVGEAVTRAPRDLGFVRRVLKRVLAITLVLEFIVNVYALPLAFELVGILVVFVFVGMQALVQHDESTDPRVRTFIDGVLVIVGLVYLVYFAVRVFTDLDRFLTRENAEDFLVAPVLTIALIPFLYGVGWASRRDQENLRKRWRNRRAGGRSEAEEQSAHGGRVW